MGPEDQDTGGRSRLLSLHVHLVSSIVPTFPVSLRSDWLMLRILPVWVLGVTWLLRTLIVICGLFVLCFEIDWTFLFLSMRQFSVIRPNSLCLLTKLLCFKYVPMRNTGQKSQQYVDEMKQKWNKNHPTSRNPGFSSQVYLQLMCDSNSWLFVLFKAASWENTFSLTVHLRS